MEISFREKKLKKICEDERKLIREFNLDQSEKISQRLGELSSAETLFDISKLPSARLHLLLGDFKGCFSVDIKHPYRIILKSLNGDVNDIKTISKIMIEKIMDYH